MVHLTVRLTTKTGGGHQLVHALRTVMRQALLNGGCARAHIAADVDAANTFWYSEQWTAVEELEAQMRNERFSHLLALFETAAEPPLVEFSIIADTRGLEYVAAVREAAGATGK